MKGLAIVGPRLMVGAGGDGYCGKMRSKNLSGANFVAYDDGIKVLWCGLLGGSFV